MKRLLITLMFLVVTITTILAFPTTGKAGTLSIVDYPDSPTTETSSGGGETMSTQGVSDTPDTKGTGNKTLDNLLQDTNSDSVIGDDGTIQNVDPEAFKNKIYLKMFEGTTVVQKVGLIIALLFTIIGLIATVVMWFVDRKKTLSCVIGVLVCLIIFVVIYYAPNLVMSFRAWWAAE
jgi:hypothetical protein